MDPSEWGPAGWKFLHSITFAQPEFPNTEQQNHIRQFFESLAHVIPCKRCSAHYQAFIRDNPVPTENRELLARWLVDLHNNANKSNRAKLPYSIPAYTYSDALKRYGYPSDVLSNPPPREVLTGLRVLAVVFVVLVVACLAGALSLAIYSCTGGRVCPLTPTPGKP